MIEKRASELFDKLISIRRNIHMHPELGMEEKETNKKIRAFLDEAEIKNETIAETGVVGIIGTGEAPVVALRADMDALPIQEETGVPFKSKINEKMHACGHDMHTTILLGAAKILKEMESDLKGTVKLLFEPAEETVGGAIQMIKEGCLVNPEVDAVLGLHVMPELNTGKVEMKYGKLNASSDTITIKALGKSGHGAYPESSVDAIVIAGNIVTALQTIVSRNTSPFNTVALSFGAIRGGEYGNIIADKVTLKGTLRTSDPQTRDYVKQRITDIATHQAKAYGGDAEVIIEEGYKPLINDDKITRILEDTLTENIGRDNIQTKEFPSLGVESFAFFSSEVPGCFYRLGCKHPDDEAPYPIHNSKFNPDERCIETGVTLQVKTALNLMNELNK